MHDFELLVFIIWIAGTTIKDVIDSKIGLMLFSGEILQKKPQKCLKCHTPIVVETDIYSHDILT